MSNTNEPEVKDIERIEIAPAGGENVDEETETPPDSSQETTKTDEDEEETEEVTSEEAAKAVEDEPEIAAPKIEIPDEKYGEVKRLPNETPREFAYRIEIARLRGEERGKQTQEIMTPAPAPVKKELSPERKKVLEKYKPEDLNVLKEVFDVMAEDMGFVRKDDLGATTYQQKAGEVLDEFLEKHPEYQAQNDHGSVLWNRFKEEYSFYRPTQNPRDLKKVLDKVHKEVFGIKPAADLNKQDAAKERIKVASHSGASRPAPSREGVKRANTPIQGLRTDMLKGFSEQEIADLTAE